MWPCAFFFNHVSSRSIGSGVFLFCILISTPLHVLYWIRVVLHFSSPPNLSRKRFSAYLFSFSTVIIIIIFFILSSSKKNGSFDRENGKKSYEECVMFFHYLWPSVIVTIAREPCVVSTQSTHPYYE